MWKRADCILVVLICGLCGINNFPLNATQESATQKSTTQESSPQYVFDFAEVDDLRQQADRAYKQFLDAKSLHCGIYTLQAGAKDGQQPHTQDEVYYVESGVATINIDGEDFPLKKGSIVFVPANTQHKFHSITEDLRTLVFFSKAPVASDDNR